MEYQFLNRGKMGDHEAKLDLPDGHVVRPTSKQRVQRLTPIQVCVVAASH